MNMRHYIKKFVHSKSLRPVAAGVCAALITGLVMFFLYKTGTFFSSSTVAGIGQVDAVVSVSGQQDFKSFADKIIAQCAASSYRPTCYDEEVPKLMSELTMEQTFQVTSLVQDRDGVYTYCHVLGHKLAAQEVAKDPSKWKDVVARSPRGICSNGSIHGAFQERFRRESLTDAEIVQLKPELQDVCEPRGSWRPTGLEQGSCYHAMGHLVMYITSGEIKRATELCGDLALKNEGRADWRQLCYDGAFMQIFQPLEPDDFALVKGKQPTKKELAAFCSGFTGLLRGPCWNEGWPLYKDEILTAQGLDAYCGSLFLTAPADRERCYGALFYVVTAQLGLDVSDVATFCSGLNSVPHQASCYANGAGRMIETDYRNIPSALKLCSDASANLKEACFSELVKDASYDFPPGSPDAARLCAGMPEPWQSKCESVIGIR